MTGRCNRLVQRSRRWGLCGTTLCGAGIVLAVMGAGPMPPLKAEPEPRPVAVELLAAPAPHAATQVTPVPPMPPAVAEPAVAEPETTPEVAAPVVPKTVPQAARPSKALPRKVSPAPERRPRQSPPRVASAPVAASVAASVATPTPPAAASTSPSTMPSTGAASTHAAQQKASLLAQVMALFEQHKRYPPAARKLGLEGVVRMQVRVSTQGGITDIRLLDSNAHAMLCKSGMESLRKVQEHWTPQPQEREVLLEIAVRYRLAE